MSITFLSRFFQQWLKHLATIKSKQYQLWKQNAFASSINNSYILITITCALFLLLASLIVMDSMEDSDKLINIVLKPIVLSIMAILQYLLSTKSKILFKRYSMLFNELICFFHQVIIQYVLMSSKLFGQIAIGVVLTCFTKFYPKFTFKLLSVTSIIVECVTFNNDQNTFQLIFTVIVLAIIIILDEIVKLREFITISSILNVIEIIPQAMCIVNQNTKELIYVNEQYETLSKKLNRINQTPFSLDSPENKVQRQQIELLQNLKLDEVEDVDLLTEIDEFSPDNLYQIKKVLYSREEQEPQIVNNLCWNNQISSPIKSFFKFFRNDAQTEIVKKVFTSDVTLILEVNHQPNSYVQSALKKQRKKSSSSFIAKKQRQSDLSLPQQSPEKKLSQAPFVEHKMKFLVYVMDNFRVQNEDLQVFFLHDLSSMMLKGKVQELEQVKKNMMRSISHEMVTYLNGAYAIMCDVNEKLKDHPNEFSKQIQTAYNYLTLQFYKIKDFSDFQEQMNGQFQLMMELFDLKESITFCLELIQNQIIQKKLTLNVEIPDEEIIVYGDKQKFLQLILNLLSNAIRFTYYGGITITICTEVTVEDLTEKVVEVRITDSGIGMDEEQLGLITKKLLSIDDDERISKHSVGIGMGLSVCKAIVNQMGPENMNTIFVQSQKECGSQFYFYLKRKQKFETSSMNNEINLDEINSEHNIQPLKENAQKKFFKQSIDTKKNSVFQKGIEISFSDFLECKCNKVLIVDDELFNCNVLAEMLNHMGYEYDQCLNGLEGLQQFKRRIQNKCSLTCCIYKSILLDINMPVMDGWEAVREMRKLEKQSRIPKKIPIIAVTAFSSNEDKKKCLDEGFNMVITKPTNRQVIQKAIEDLQKNQQKNTFLRRKPQ